MRKKRLILAAVIMLCGCLLTGCQCEHAWTEANCTVAKTCTKCGITEGEALGHTWSQATCTAPKTCSVCETTEGTILPHTWKAASCTDAAICSVCKQENGDLLGHDWSEESTDVWKKCNRCKKEFEYYYGSDKEELKVWTEYEFDSNGTLMNLVSYDAEAESFPKRKAYIKWVKDGQVQFWNSDQEGDFLWDLFYVDGKVYYREREGTGSHTARKLAQVARQYISFETIWYIDGDHIDLAETKDYWDLLDNPLGSASCAVDVNGTKYVIIHKGARDDNPLETFAVQTDW